MDFNDTSTSQGIVQDVYFLTETNSTSYATADIVRNANRWAYKAVTWIIRSNKRWSFDDSNLTDPPILSDNLVAETQNYKMPSALLKIIRVEVKDSSGNFRLLRPLDEAEIPVGLTEYKESSGLPTHYDLVGDYIYLYPKPAAASVTTSSGLRYYVLREIDLFVAADTTQEPGFADPFHRIVSLGAAYDYCTAKEQHAKADRYLRDIETLKMELMAFYTERDNKTKVRINTLHRQGEYL